MTQPGDPAVGAALIDAYQRIAEELTNEPPDADYQYDLQRMRGRNEATKSD